MANDEADQAPHFIEQARDTGLGPHGTLVPIALLTLIADIVYEPKKRKARRKRAERIADLLHEFGYTQCPHCGNILCESCGTENDLRGY